jgi:hypothetical protein
VSEIHEFNLQLGVTFFYTDWRKIKLVCVLNAKKTLVVYLVNVVGALTVNFDLTLVTKVSGGS